MTSPWAEWPPDPSGGGAGALQIGVTPVVGGTPLDFLKVGAGGLLDESTVPAASVAIGAPVVGGVAPAVLFVGAGNVLAEDQLYFGYDKATHQELRSAPASNGLSLKTITPQEANTPKWYQRLGGATFTGQFDPTYAFGWNINGAGAAADLAFGTVAIGMEGAFDPGVGDGFGQELHLMMGKADNSARTRVLTFSNKQNTGRVDGQLTADAMLFIDRSTTGPWGSYTGPFFGGITPAFQFTLRQFVIVSPTLGTMLVVDDSGGFGNVALPFAALDVTGIALNGQVARFRDPNAPGATWEDIAIGGDRVEHNVNGNARYRIFSGYPVADSIALRTATTIGGEQPTNTVASLTVVAKVGQTAPLIDVSSVSGSKPLFAAVFTTDIHPGVPAGALKIVVAGVPFYIPVVS